ncbi:Fungal Zn(2)-Cys(6) binuclear cluster domain family protein [Clavispora lusitaniae]|uniref:Zn(2)-C6 fungal-type domain-containing protein n=1 Tax=Clavispora lusitaniae (strain ATCC 42720) TaxID=306902 RepID=C4Y9C3_CLAL4|nr:uncharacterized protein CLUG_04801 [Clavispora lusitaniae ATCC 42720]EEQ40673.1 hypothetical protein CLUG_04801 [Clavispora lusitaniae ATCC 42720]KAF7581415.1 Fungal Zn(2)-Cys(6) binuclear cluster domain family protein [Clavispora lusitaniae]
MVLTMQRRRDLVVPKSLKKGNRVLKSCTRCRSSKIRCDAMLTQPWPCTFCSKRSFVCMLDVSQPAKREYDVTERLVADVRDLHHRLDRLVLKKTRLVQQLLSRQGGVNTRRMPQATPQTPPVAQIQTILQSPHEKSPSDTIYIDPIPTLALEGSFTIHSDQKSQPLSLSHARVSELFENFNQNFRHHLPVLPESFFHKDLQQIHRESDLLFWVIVATSFLNQKESTIYLQLVPHVRNLVVVNCWFNTPRSVYSLVALLILTTWPLPNGEASKIQDDICVKYVSLMKSLALQFGLHKPSFLSEFSKKTSMSMDATEDENRQIRERIYKYVNINSNYWLVYLGLSNSNYNGFQMDYITDKAANVDIFNREKFSPEDNFTNSLLKVSLLQSKMNENMSDLLHSPSHVSKLIHLHMFEKILNAYKAETSPFLQDDLLCMSVEYSKLHLYIYYLSNVDITLSEYKDVIYQALNCCKRILTLFETNFSTIENFYQVPIHYRFAIELSSLLLLSIHSSPLLNSINDYLEVKADFARAYTLLKKTNEKNWARVNGKLFKVIEKFDACDKRSLLAIKNQHKSFFLINKMTSYLVSSLSYEMIWDIYQMEKSEKSSDSLQIDWEIYGLDCENMEHKQIMDYLMTAKSIIPLL